MLWVRELAAKPTPIDEATVRAKDQFTVGRLVVADDDRLAATKRDPGLEPLMISAGGLLVIPPDVRHWGEVVGDEPVLNLDVFTPKRAEYAA